MTKKQILITGGAGFVGSHLAILLSQTGHGVTALDNLKRRGSELNLHRLQEAGVSFIHGDIRQPEDLALEKPMDVIIECSAEPSVLAGYHESPRYVLDTNLVGAIHCLELARKHKADFIFLSTSRVYPIQTIRQLNYRETETRLELGENQTVGVTANGFTEDFPITGNRSLYGTTKLCAELLLQEYLALYGLRGVIDRCGVITGPWQMGKVDQGVVVLWMARHVYQQPLQYIGYNGKQVRDILHIQDLYDLIALQLDCLPQINGQIFNIGGGRKISISLRELTSYAQRMIGRTMAITSIDQVREGDIPLYLSDCAKIEAMLGWKPRRGVEAILSDIVEWILKNQKMLEPILN